MLYFGGGTFFKTEIRFESVYFDKCCGVDLGWVSMAGKAWRSAVCTENSVNVVHLTHGTFSTHLLTNCMAALGANLSDKDYRLAPRTSKPANCSLGVDLYLTTVTIATGRESSLQKDSLLVLTNRGCDS